MQIGTSLQTDTMPAPHHLVFYRPDALLNQQRQSTEGSSTNNLCNMGIYYICCQYGSAAKIKYFTRKL